MNLDHLINKQKQLILVSLISLGFIGISAYLIIAVGNIEKEQAIQGEDVRILNTIQNSSFDVYTSLVEGDVPDWNRLSNAYDKLADQTLHDDDLELITDMILEIKVIADRRRKVDIEPLREKLATLIHHSNLLLEEHRTRMTKLSMKRDQLSNYMHITLLFACLLSLGLIYSLYRSLLMNKSLKEVKKKNRMIFNQALNCIIIADGNGRIIEFNKAAEELFGYENSEVAGKNFETLYKSKSDLKRVKEAMEEKGRFIGEVVNQRKDGSHFVSFLTANLIYDQKGNLIGSMGVSRDITKEKEKEQEYENILDNATDIIITTDRKGKCTFVNDAARSQLGYNYRDLIDHNLVDFIHPDDQERVAIFFEHQIEQRISETYLEFKILKKNGDSLMVEQISKVLPSPTNKNYILGLQGIIRNLEGRSEAEKELKKREASYRDLFENTSELIHNMKDEGEILYANKSWQEKFGYSGKAVESLNFFLMLEEEQRKELRELIAAIHKGKSKEDRMILLTPKTKKGKKLELETVISESNAGGSEPTFQLFMRDVTEELKAKKTLGKTESNLRILAESIDDLFYLWNKSEDKYEYISHGCQRMLGVPPEEFKKASEFENQYVHPDDLESYQKGRAGLEKGEEFDLDYRIIVKDKINWINEKIFPIKNKEGIIYMHSGVMRDISQHVKSREIIRSQSEEIGKSLSYAQRMQENMLVELQKIKKELPGLYVYFKPKDNISGDFFIVEHMLNKDNEELIILAVADCTGNGVPAGMFSFLCNSLTKEALLSRDVDTPAAALEYVRERILSLFKFDEAEYVYDAMNISLCLINPSKEELQYAGGNQPLFLMRNDQIMEIKGSRQHIGYNFKTMPFKNHKVTTSVGDTIYLFTDGFYSQFGGKDGKKMMKSGMKDFLLSLSALTPKDQKKKVSEFFEEWKGDQDQLDDVTLAAYQV